MDSSKPFLQSLTRAFRSSLFGSTFKWRFFSKSSFPSLLDLNDDCLLLICEYLILRDHMSLYRSCARLQNVIERFYQHKQIVTLAQGNGLPLGDKEALHKFLVSFRNSIFNSVKEINVLACSQDLQLFVQQLSTKIKALDVFWYNTGKALHCSCRSASRHEIYDDLQCTFPNLTQLSIEGHSHSVLTAEKFPKLSKLRLAYKIRPQHVKWNFAELTELELDLVEISTEQSKQIFNALPLKKLTMNKTSTGNYNGISACQTLEELVLSEDFLDQPIDELMTLRKLRKLTYKDIQDGLLCLPVHSRLVYRTLSIVINWFLIEMVGFQSTFLKELKLEFQRLGITEKLKDLKHLKLHIGYIELSKQTVATDQAALSDCVLELLQHCSHLQTLQLDPPNWAAVQILERAAHIFEERQEPIFITICADDPLQRRKHDINVGEKLKLLALNDFMEIKQLPREKVNCERIFECDILPLND